MSKPIVAIVGRPNVGKSTLFNVIAGDMISIVKDTPGVTRDRIYADCTWLDKNFTLVDTGGIEPDSSDVILSQMREQAEIAIATADVIIFLKMCIRDRYEGTFHAIVAVLRQIVQLVQMGGYDLIQLNYRDSKPIYEQIKDGFRKLIITNSLSANEKLPSVRELASGLAINPNTVSYTHLDVYKRQMVEYDKIMPGYGFAANKGYGSAEHIAALKKYGPTSIHRRSFIGNFVEV